ncbi:MAG TPA: peptide ABC transporter substrate-binding protein, partial [Polyangiaceae bacterium]|nr:peptide ABC transporter substrate-binding protein [Polyangiaceae bacterium]
GKPVVAADFEYAWKRILDPKTQSQSAATLYMIKNGELFNQGKLKLTKTEIVARSGPDDDAPEAKRLPARTPVVILGRSPLHVDTAVPPWTTIPTEIDGLGYDKADAKTGAPERAVVLREKGNDVIATSADTRLPAADYALVRRLGPVVCNGEPDHWLEVEALDGSKKRGLLPGCMTSPAKSDKSLALVAEWSGLPTFRAPVGAPPASAEPPSPEPIGFVPVSSLESDASVLGVRAVDDRTLELELDFPVPYILDVLCSAATDPVRRDVVEAFEAKGDPDGWTRPETMVSNGPYRLKTWRFRYELTFDRNPYHRYFDKLAIHDITWMAVESYVSTMNLYKAGELDYIGDNSALPPPYLPVLRKKKDFEIGEYLAEYWYELNTKSPPLDDVRVRRALNLAVDKQALIDNVVRGSQTPATHFVPDFTGQGYKTYLDGLRAAGKDPFHGKGRDFDPALARSLLEEAGYHVVKDGDGYRADGMPPLELLYNTSEGHRVIAVAIQDMWKKNLGVSVTLRNEEWKVMLKNVRDRNYQIVRFGWVADYDHPQTFMDTFMANSPNNRTGWANGKFDELVQRARTTADVNESMRQYVEAEKILADEVPKLPLYFYTKTTLIKPYMKGFHFNRRNIQMVTWMRVDPGFATDPSDAPAIEPNRWPEPGDFASGSAEKGAP